MKKYDLIVIGSGSGLKIVSFASGKGLKVALIEQGPLGGTCLNRGCIPSKMLIHIADIIETINSSKKFSIRQKGYNFDFQKIIKNVSNVVDKESREIESTIKSDKNITLYKTTSSFISHKTIKSGKDTITSDKIIIAAGSRPFIPQIEGLSSTNFITSDEALRLNYLPKSMAIIGGGYIATELAHFFGILGTKITIIEVSNSLIQNEDEEISKKFTQIFSKRYNVLTSHKAIKVSQKGKTFEVTAKKDNAFKKIISEQLLIAVGRIPNSDILNIDKTGVATSNGGYIQVNEYMETNVKGIWALGDIAGKYFFKHSANLEADLVKNNLFGKKEKIDYHAMPHSIFTSPQIAGVGFTEQELIKQKIPYQKSIYEYKKTGMGLAIKDIDGFVKFLVDKKTKKILGCHIIGTDASTLIHEVVVAMKSGDGSIQNIKNAVHAHPALSEVIQKAANIIQ